MTDGSEPINPATVYTDKQLPHTGAVIRYEDNYAGLTKLEYFSSMVMQGLVTRSVSDLDFQAAIAVKAATALIEALNKQP